MKYFLGIFSAFIVFQCIYSSTDKICDSQKEIIGNAFRKQNPVSKYIFTNDSKTSVQVTWAGENSGKIIIVTTKEVHFFFTFADLSDIYFSDNNGKTFKKITETLPVKSVIVRKDNGLQRNSLNNHNIFLVCYNTIERSSLLLTEDGGETWKKVDIDFILDQEIQFHPFNKLWMLTSNKAGKLYKSTDGGYKWNLVLDNVQQYQWTTDKRYPQDIFAKTIKSNDSSLINRFFGIKNRPSTMNLEKSSDGGKTWKTIKKNIFAFLLRDKFLYVSEVIIGNRRRLSVSTDNGNSFNKVYLPTIGTNQFYSILNIEEDLVYIHVDNPDNLGDGTLFTSDSEGQIFSQSLKNHFYPSPRISSDFYKIESMRGTYIASQLNPDKSIQSLITFNRGAEWKRIKKPENELCHNKDKTDCYLQITGTFSLINNVPSSLPQSTKTAIGIVLVHGHLANSLKSSKSDVYISSDGGYNWIKALNGPHEYVIADHGGLLVALGENKQFIKFSTDEGRCWHEHQYTTEEMQVTGLLTEPGNKAMTVAIWGYNKTDNQWIIHVVDLSQLLDRECNASDYEKWYAHSDMMHPLGEKYAGCLLGKKEEFLRLKKDSLCKNGYSHEITKKEEICPCTEDDFECEYGYYREVNSKNCTKNNLINENICIKGVVEKIVTQGYKKLPSDVCVGGFSPDKTKQTLLNEICKDDELIPIKKKMNNNNATTMNSNSMKTMTNKRKINNLNYKTREISLKQTDGKSSKVLIIAFLSGSLIMFGFILGFILITRRRIIKNKTSNLKYKVLAGLSGKSGTDDDAPLLTNEVGYESVSPSKTYKKNTKRGSDDSDVDLIG